MDNLEKVKYIEIVLENCEVIRINIEHIEFLSVRGIAFNDFFSIYTDGKKRIERNTSCKYLNIVINKKADKIYKSFGMFPDFTVFERLTKHDDITAIDYLDGNAETIESISVPWKDKVYEDGYVSEENSSCQSSKIDENGNLEIIIKGEDEF